MTSAERPSTSLPEIMIRRDDVPVAAAMLMWNDEVGPWFGGTSKPLPPVVANHDTQSEARPERWDNSTGACFGDWRDRSTESQLARTMIDAWMAVVRDGVQPAAMHEALLAIPEFRAEIHPDELPDCYRDDGDDPDASF